MLTVDPNKRITMEQIIKHKWMILAGEDIDFDALILENNRPSDVDPDLENLNEHIIAHMESIDLNREQIFKVMKHMCSCSMIPEFQATDVKDTKPATIPSIPAQLRFYAPAEDSSSEDSNSQNSDSEAEEPSPEALARYLAMRRHTVGVGDSDMKFQRMND
ncbi:SIK3 [Mytilus coruscus]|uniref:SIK3 n=1 Tax=Mytilus coruscus TaxID=42192 RepID=A0A6J7ZXP4_MYTCO|nr:SIK3 [Mytilus coruscus]